jgi:3-oxoadipate CoA-transferase beta subunit
VACVSRIYTDVAVFLIDRDAPAEDADVSVLVRETHGMTFDELQALVSVPLRRA